MENLLTPKNILKSIAGLIVFIILLVTLLKSFYQIESGTRGLVFTNGSLNSVADEGLHLKMPFFQSVKKIDVTTQSATVDKMSAASKDLQEVRAGVTVNYRYDINKLTQIYEQTKFDIDTRILQPRVQEALKAVAAKYTAEELIVKRSQVKSELDILLRKELAKYNVIVDDVQLVHFDFSPEFNKAIEAKQTEVQNALKAKNILERTKIESEQRIAQAKGEAEAIRIQAEAIQNQGGAEYVNLKWIEKWSGNMPQTVASDQAMIMIPVSK